MIRDLLNKTSVLNSLSSIEFDSDWIEAQTIGPGPTPMTTAVNITEESTENSIHIAINVSANLLLSAKNFTMLVNLNTTELLDSNKTESLKSNTTDSAHDLNTTKLKDTG